MKATVENIKTIIEAAGISGSVNDLQLDVPLTKQGLDSLDMVNIYLQIEEEFDIKIPDEDLTQVQTIEDMIEYVNAAESNGSAD